MTTTHTLTGTVTDLIGEDARGSIKVFVLTNLGGAALVDRDNDFTKIPAIKRVPTNGGTFAVDLIATDSTGTNVEGDTLRYQVQVQYTDARNVSDTWSSPWFTLTADADLSDKVADEYLPPTIASATLAEMQALVAQAETITGLTGEDEAVAALIGSPTSDTRAALNGQIAGQVATATADLITIDDVVPVVQSATVSQLDGYTPTFTRLNGGNPVFSVSTPGQAAVSVYWPWIVDAKALFGVTDPAKRYRMYYSTDHAAHADSGVWYAEGPAPIGPWTPHARVFRDDTPSTSQTETPTVFADPTGTYKAIMLYQQQAVPGANGSQSTCWAYSNDGDNWTIGGLAIDIPAVWPGDGHTGYARVVQIGGQLYAHGLAGGGDYPTFALSTSLDGRAWVMQSSPLLYNMDIVGDGRRIEWNTTDIVRWRGQLWWIGFLSDFVSGATPKNGRLAIAPIAEDMRTLLAPPKRILYPTVGAENTNYRSTKAFVADTGHLYLYYQCGNNIYLAEGV